MKWMWPDRVCLNRGNHETNGESDLWHQHVHISLTRADMNKVYGFEGEAKSKYGEMTYKLFADVFTARKLLLPFLVATVATLPSTMPYQTSTCVPGLTRPVPLAVLLSAGSDPSNLKSEGSQPAILSDQGRKRYFVCHGGPPVSKDGVTLDQVAKIDRWV